MSQSWKVAYVSTIISKAISVSDLEFDLDHVRGRVVTSEEVKIPASQTIVVKGLIMIIGHHKHVHVLVESSPKCVNVFVLGNTFEVRPGMSKIEVVIQNGSRKDVKVKLCTKIGTVTTANIVPTTQVSNDLDGGEQERVYLCWLRWNPLTYWGKLLRGVMIQEISYKDLICLECRSGNLSCKKMLRT